VFGGQNGALDDGIPCHAHTCPFYQGLYGGVRGGFLVSLSQVSSWESDGIIYKMLNSNQMIRCSTPTTEKICKLNQKYQHGNLRIHDQNIQVCLHILFLDGEKFLGELILQGNQQLVACCITFLIMLKTSNNILIFVNQHRFIL
jgi:hypothetical protein